MKMRTEGCKDVGRRLEDESPENEWLVITEKKFFDRAYEIF